MSQPTVTVRSLSLQDAIKETPVLDLPILDEGTLEQCKAYAEMFGYEWKPDDNVFGGYYVGDDGHVMLLV